LYLLWINEPDQGYEESINEKHDEFFFDDTIFMAIKVMKSNVLNSQCHKSSRKKHPNSVLDGKGKLLICRSLMFLQERKVVQHRSKYQLIEKNNEKQEQVHNENGNLIMGICM